MNRNNTRIIAFILAAIIAGASTACTPVEPQDCYAVGTLTTRYRAKSPEYIGDVFNASKAALGQLGHPITGETSGKDKVSIYARTTGEIPITVDIYKKFVETKEGEKQEWVYLAVRYGKWGNCKQSQEIISKITNNLR